MRCRYRRRKTDARNLSRGQHCPLPEPSVVGVSNLATASCESSVGTDAAQDLCGRVRAAGAAVVPHQPHTHLSNTKWIPENRVGWLVFNETFSTNRLQHVMSARKLIP